MTGLKIRNSEYSQCQGREEMFERPQEPITVGSCLDRGVANTLELMRKGEISFEPLLAVRNRTFQELAQSTGLVLRPILGRAIEDF
jgi:hypothetical protein